MSLKTDLSMRWDPNAAKPTKLFIAWYLLILHQNEDWVKTLGRKYIKLGGGVRHCMEDNQVMEGLFELYTDGFITSLIVRTPIPVKGSNTLDSEYNIVAPKKPTNLPEDFSYSELMPSLGRGGYKLFHVWAEIDEKKMAEFIDDYLARWANNDLYFFEHNILRREKQIERLVEDIFVITREHSSKNFLLIEDSQRSARNEADFTATALFLERIGDIKLIGFLFRGEFDDYRPPEKKALQFRISLTEKFFEDFSYSQRTGRVYFDFRDLTSGNRKNKIFFDAPYRLWTKKNDYRLNKGKIPYELLNMAFDDAAVQSVPIKDLQERIDNDEKGVHKSLDNFRRNLREKFGYPESEQFFSVKDDEILIDSKIFKKSVKKEEIALK